MAQVDRQRRRSVLLPWALGGLLHPAIGHAGPAPAPDAGPRLGVADLQADLQAWHAAVLQRHPRFHGQTRLDEPLERAFAAARAAITGPLSRREAFSVLSRINPALRDGHTLLMPWLSGQEPDDRLRARLFPFGVDLDGAGALRLRSHWQRRDASVTLTAGARLLAVNGEPIEPLLADLAAHSHGETHSLQRHLLTLMWPLWLHALRGVQDRFTVSIATAAGAPRTLEIVADGQWVATRVPPLQPAWSRHGDVAWLRVPTFDIDEAPAEFERALDRAFSEILASGLSALVVDVRGNTGGQSDAASLVLKRFIDRPTAMVSSARERLNEDNNGWFGHRGAPGTLRTFDLTRTEVVRPLPPAQRWRGRTALLVDALSYSATLLLATALQDLGKATVVGQPTGGHANQTGNMMPTRLPRTGFTAYIATREFVRLSGRTTAEPLRPDIEVPTAPEDPQGADASLEHAVAWLRKSAT